MSKQPLFSVIVPVYKVEKYLNKCIDSILAQTFDDFELILVDDGSPDNCPAICDAYAQNDKRIRVIHKANGGLVLARKTGLLAASGRYICWADGDDFVSGELLEYLHHVLQSQDEPDIICFDYYRYYEDREPYMEPSTGNDPVPGLYDKKRLERELYPYMLRDSRKKFATSYIYGAVWCKCFRRDLIIGHYCKEPRITVGEDMAFSYECLFFADSVFCSDKVLYYYRQRNGSMIHSFNRMFMDQMQLAIHYLRTHFEVLSDLFPRQVEDRYISYLMEAVFAFPRHHVPLLQARREVKEMVRRTGVLRDIRVGKTVPFYICVAIWMLRRHLYLTTLATARLFIFIWDRI